MAINLILFDIGNIHSSSNKNCEIRLVGDKLMIDQIDIVKQSRSFSNDNLGPKF